MHLKHRDEELGYRTACNKESSRHTIRSMLAAFCVHGERSAVCTVQVELRQQVQYR